MLHLFDQKYRENCNVKHNYNCINFKAAICNLFKNDPKSIFEQVHNHNYRLAVAQFITVTL